MDDKELEKKLVLEARAGNVNAEEELFRSYKNFIKIKAHTYVVLGADVEDVMQEGMIGLFKAVKTYDENRDVSFKTYAEVCINSQIINAIKKYSRKKHFPLNYSLSLDNVSDTDDEKGISLMEELSGSSYDEPESVLLMKEKMQKLKDESYTHFSTFENKVMIEILHGKNIREISNKLGKSEKSIDNAVQRIRKKLEEHFNY